MVRRGTNSQSLVGKRTRRLRGRASTSTRRHRTSTLDCVSRRLGPRSLQLGYTELTEWRLFAEKPVTKLKTCTSRVKSRRKRSKRGYIKWRHASLLLAESYEGYELSSSTNHNAGLHNEYFPWHAFNELSHHAEILHVGACHKYAQRRGAPVERSAKTRSITSDTG